MKMKTLLIKKTRQWSLVLAALLFGGHLIAQTVIESWDFEGEEVIPAGFVNIDVDQTTAANTAWAGDQGPSQWILTGKPKPNNGGNLAVSAISWLDPLGMADDWLITPSVDLTSVETAFLSLNFSMQQVDWPDGFRVLISTTGNDISDFPDANVLFEVGSGCGNNPQSVASDAYWDCNCDPGCPDDFANNWGNVLVDVSEYSGGEVYIAVHHNANDQYALFIDDITVFEPVANEAAITAVAPPSFFAVGPAEILGDMEFKATVSNNGSEPLTNVRLSVLVEEVSDGENPVMVAELDGAGGAAASIAPSASAEVSNGSNFTFTEQGFYLVTYEVIAAEGDVDETNNVAQFPYMVNDTLLGGAAIFPDPADPSGPGVLAYDDQSFTLWGGTDDTETEGLLGYYFTVPTTQSMSGVAFDVGFDETNGVGYDPGTDIRIALIDTTGSLGDRSIWTSDAHLVATTGPLMGLTANEFSKAYWSCPVDLQPGVNYLLAYHKVGPGDGGFVYNGYYFNSGSVFADGELGDVNGLLPPGQPAIHAIFGAAQALQSVMAQANTMSLTVDFSADVVGSACDYAWDFGDGNTATGPFVTHTFADAGSYEVCVTATNDDGSSSLEDCIMVDVACALVVEAGDVSPSSIEVVASNGSGNYTYTWSDGQTGATAVDLAADTEYTVTVADDAGCSADYTASTVSCALTLAIDPIDAGSALASITGNTGDVTYTWTNDGTGESFESDQAFQSNLSGGTWSVTVTDASNCSTMTTVVLGGTGIEDVSSVSDFSMLPNPSSDYVNIKLNLESTSAVSVAIYATNGQLVRQVLSGQFNQINETINLDGLNAGLYMVKFVIDQSVVAEKLIIK